MTKRVADMTAAEYLHHRATRNSGRRAVRYCTDCGKCRGEQWQAGRCPACRVVNRKRQRYASKKRHLQAVRNRAQFPCEDCGALLGWVAYKKHYVCGACRIHRSQNSQLCRDCQVASVAPNGIKRCPTCHAAWRARTRGQTYYLTTYGITLDDYSALLLAQQSVCAICNNPETATKKGVLLALGVDHCHECEGRESIRGLLCQRCNRVNTEDPVLLRAAADYFEKHLVVCSRRRADQPTQSWPGAGARRLYGYDVQPPGVEAAFLPM